MLLFCEQLCIEAGRKEECGDAEETLVIAVKLTWQLLHETFDLDGFEKCFET